MGLQHPWIWSSLLQFEIHLQYGISQPGISTWQSNIGKSGHPNGNISVAPTTSTIKNNMKYIFKKSSFIAKIHVLPPVFCVSICESGQSRLSATGCKLLVLAFKKDTNQTSIANNSEISGKKSNNKKTKQKQLFEDVQSAI